MNGNGKESSKRRKVGETGKLYQPTSTTTNAILIKICTHIEQKETETTRPKRFPSLLPINLHLLKDNQGTQLPQTLPLPLPHFLATAPA